MFHEQSSKANLEQLIPKQPQNHPALMINERLSQAQLIPARLSFNATSSSPRIE